jgi:pyruvate/2-oxoglutarate dehydrogenase complex dihydrolipoamide dehydrogenase (E3) component
VWRFVRETISSAVIGAVTSVAVIGKYDITGTPAAQPAGRGRWRRLEAAVTGRQDAGVPIYKGTMDSYSVVIIGAGQAGMPLARALASSGKRTALIERKHVGGSCINFGCTPTKAAIASARLAHAARRGGEFGIRIPTIEVDFPAVIQRARRIVDKFRGDIERGFTEKENPKLIRGHARLDGREGQRFRVRVGDQVIVADQVVLDTGTRSKIPPIEGIADVSVIHAGNWLDHDRLPQRLVIIGGGVIALEMAQFYRRLGSNVAIVEMNSQVGGSEDADVASALQEILAREGIEFHLETQIEHVREGVVRTNRGELTGTDIFVAAGRTPNTDDLGLETVGVQADHGFVKVDDRLATNVRGIWAAGDIRGGPMFTHTAWDDHRVVYSQLAGDGSRTTKRVVPYAIFTDPEVGRAGMTEAQARQSGKRIKVARYEMRRNSKSVELGETDGFIKLVADADTDQLLGVAILSYDAAELVHICIDLMNARAPLSVIRNAVYIHPTLAEAVQSAALMV